MIRAPLLVGLVLITAVSAMSWFLMKTSKDKFSDEATYPVYADFVDASGKMYIVMGYRRPRF